MKPVFLTGIFLGSLTTNSLATADTYRVDEGPRRLSVESDSQVIDLYPDASLSALRDLKLEIPLSSLKSKRLPSAATTGATGSAAAGNATGSAAHNGTQSELPPSATQAAAPKPAPSNIPPLSAEDSLAEINALYFKKNYPAALERVEELLKRDPKIARAWLMKGSLLHLAGRQEQAEAAWGHAKSLEASKSTEKEK